MSTNSNRGGAREGAGRPKGESTKLIRVPLGAVDDVRNVIDAYREKDMAESHAAKR